MIAAGLLQKERVRQHDSVLTGNLRYREVMLHPNEALFFNHVHEEAGVQAIIEEAHQHDGRTSSWFNYWRRRKIDDFFKCYSWEYLQSNRNNMAAWISRDKPMRASGDQ